MYRHCIHCSAHLGANQAVEAFPVGRTLAFDAAKGRLWAVCPRCARWNLAPIEERWEAIEAAEIGFERARTRVQRENVGLAKLADGSRLIRVGQALPVEVAAWRYGSEMARRRWRHVARSALAYGVYLYHGPVVMAWFAAELLYQGATGQLGRTLVRLPEGEVPGRRGETVIFKGHVGQMELHPGDHGAAVLHLPPNPYWSDGLNLSGDAAMRVLGRAMPRFNHRGARRDQLRRALETMHAGGGADGYARHLVERSAGPVKLLKPPTSPWQTMMGRVPPPEKHLSTEALLALEMAVHEQRERRATEGELALIESAWREAEELAALADRLAAQLSGIRPADRGGEGSAPAPAE